MTADQLPITPIFRTHHSIGLSLLTLEDPTKAKAGGAVSVFGLAKEVGLTEVVIADRRVDGFISAVKGADKAGVKLCYGLVLTVCADLKDKTPESRRTESRVVLWITGGEQGYKDLLRIQSRAWTDGHFTFRDDSYGRTDWNLLKAYWTPNLALGLPYTSSFIARNTLTFSTITPDLPVPNPWVLKEMGSGLPFSPLIDGAIERYMAHNTAARLVPSKTVLYKTRADFAPYVVLRAIQSGGSWSEPKVDHLASPEFCWASYLELIGGTPAAVAS